MRERKNILEGEHFRIIWLANDFGPPYVFEECAGRDALGGKRWESAVLNSEAVTDLGNAISRLVAKAKGE